MKNRRFILVILDSTGRSARRVTIERRSIELVAAAAALVLMVSLGLSLHALVRRADAAEAEALRVENVELTRVLGQVEQELPTLRRLAMRADVGFAQLWSKSGVGVEPRTLAVGPHEEGLREAVRGHNLTTAINGDIIDLEPVALPLEVDRLEGDGRSIQYTLGALLEYFHDAERLLSHTPSIKPTNTPWITSSFGKRRDPMDGRWVMHKGIDLGGTLGREIMAPADGVVIWTGYRGGYGLTVVLHHGFGIQTHYAHLSRIRVNHGDLVRRGDVLGDMGSTGKSTGPHLHYEVRRHGQPLDPKRFILD